MNPFSRNWTPGVFLVAALLTSMPAQGAKDEKIGLVLSGGGARGLAHIGVIRALEEQNINVHIIAGTSMGAVIGALYASGRTPDELVKITRTLNWSQALNDQPARNRLAFRRKRDSRAFPTKARATLNNWVPSLPKGVVQGHNLQLLLQKQFLHVSDITDFDNLPIPFRAVAGDLVTGEQVVISSGSIATAVRASMAIPGFFAPVELNGRMLVDGGIANNLPIDVVKAMGADRVIAVDIATPLYQAAELDSIVPIVEQLTTLLTFNQLKRQYALISDKDILIKPDLEDVHTTDFDKADIAMERGYRTMVAHRQELAEFAGTTALPKTRSAKYAPPVINQIEINNDSSVSNKLIRAQIDQETGAPLNREQLEENIQAIYGYELFESINYKVVPTDAGNQLLVTARKKSWGEDQLGITFELFTDTDSESSYNLGANFRRPGITLKGGEWFTAVQFGQDPIIQSEFYLPLDYRQIFFAEPYLAYSEKSFNIVEGDDIRSRFRIHDFVYGGFFGIEVSNVSIVGAGIEAHRGHTDTFVGPDPGSDHFRDVSRYFLFELDTLDNLYFPGRGTLARIRYDRIDPDARNAQDFEIVRASATQAFQLNRNSLILAADYVRSYGQVQGRQFQQSLGGFLNLSGLPDEALVGDHLLYAGVTWLWRLDEKSVLPVDLPTYAGISLEAGNVWANHSEASAGDLIRAGTVMLGVDSPLGGVYLGYGRAEDGESSFYLKLGRLF